MNQEETMLKHKERYKKTIKNLTVMSDIFARNVFKDKKACEYVLRIIMEDKDLTVIDNETQVDFRNMHGRGVVLDCVAKDGSGRIFNVEIQQDDEGAHPKRARYHLGMMTVSSLSSRIILKTYSQAFLSLNTFRARISLITVRFLIVSLYLSLCKSIVSS